MQEEKCNICGKEFGCYGEYLYKRTDRKSKKYVYFCSWTCFRKDEKEREAERKNKTIYDMDYGDNIYY